VKYLSLVRQQLGISQIELARRLGISKTYMSLLENGYKKLHPQLLVRIAEQLQFFGDISRLDADVIIRTKTAFADSSEDVFIEYVAGMTKKSKRKKRRKKVEVRYGKEKEN
jgi:transcriptional regulator with XRE-family HTH domain